MTIGQLKIQRCTVRFCTVQVVHWVCKVYWTEARTRVHSLQCTVFYDSEKRSLHVYKRNLTISFWNTFFHSICFVEEKNHFHNRKKRFPTHQKRSIKKFWLKQGRNLFRKGHFRLLSLSAEASPVSAVFRWTKARKASILASRIAWRRSNFLLCARSCLHLCASRINWLRITAPSGSSESFSFALRFSIFPPWEQENPQADQLLMAFVSSSEADRKISCKKKFLLLVWRDFFDKNLDYGTIYVGQWTETLKRSLRNTLYITLHKKGLHNFKFFRFRETSAQHQTRTVSVQIKYHHSLMLNRGCATL